MTDSTPYIDQYKRFPDLQDYSDWQAKRIAELEQSVTKGSERIGELLERIAELEAQKKDIQDVCDDLRERIKELEHWFHGYRTPEMSMAAMQARLDAVAALYVKAPQYQKRYGPDDMRPPDHTVYVEFSRDELKAALEARDE